jgi:hypothetical protein
MSPLAFHSALLSKCSTGGSLLQRKKEAILPFKEELETITKASYTFSKLSYKSLRKYYITRRVIYQIPLGTTNAVYCGVLTLHESNSCHKPTVQNDV